MKRLFAIDKITILILLVLVASLANSDFFYYPSLTAYHFYNLTSAAFVAVAGVIWLKNSHQRLATSYLLWFPVSWMLYIICSGLVRGEFNVVHTYTLFSLLFLCGLVIVISLKPIIPEDLFIGMMTVSSIVSLICLLQFLSIIHSNSSYFRVTGTWANPNITAMFLSLIVPPIFINALGDKNGKYKVMLTLNLLALICLNCRTAYLGCLVTVVLCLAYRYDIRAITWRKLGELRVLTSFIIVTMLLLGLGIYLYHNKQSSADGRTFIWRNTVHMILNNPLKGTGYDLFARDYNLYQADLVKTGKIPAGEWGNAVSVKMAYNELLQAWAEGGIGGMITLLLTFAALIILPLKKGIFSRAKSLHTHPTGKSSPVNDNYVFSAYAGIVSFSLMSMLNFTFQAIPCMCIFIIYIAIIIQASQNRFSKARFSIADDRIRLISKTAAGALLGLCLIVGFDQFQAASADRDNKVAYQLIRTGYSGFALSNLPSLQPQLFAYESYWKNYAIALISTKNYTEALDRLKNAKKYSSDPSLYEISGYCYQKLAKYPQAIMEYQQAVYLQPYRFKPRIELMKELLLASDTADALKQARIIRDLKPKIISNEVWVYKKMANSLLSSK